MILIALLSIVLKLETLAWLVFMQGAFLSCDIEYRYCILEQSFHSQSNEAM